LACHLQIDADPDEDFDWMRIRIQVTKMMGIRIHNTGLKATLTLVSLSYFCLRDWACFVRWQLHMEGEDRRLSLPKKLD
jgi:hypothetical protein